MKKEMLEKIVEDWITRLNTLDSYYVDAELVGLDEQELHVDITIRLKKKAVLRRKVDERT